MQLYKVKTGNMKYPIPFHKLLILAVVAFMSLSTSAQYSSSNSFMLRALVKYDQETNGLYSKKENIMVTEVSHSAQPYAFDKKTSNLYVLTENGNYEITLNKDYAQAIKHNSRIPQLRGEELNQAIDRANAQLAQHFAQLNQQILDKRAADRRNAIADSLEKERELEEARAAIEKRREEYRTTHKWNRIPLRGNRISCEDDDCEDTYSGDIMVCGAIKNDTLLYITPKDFYLGIELYKAHYAKIPIALQQDEDFNYHLLAFKDSIDESALNLNSVRTVTDYLNFRSYTQAVEELKAKAPYGFITKWSWENEVTVSLELEFFNTNKKKVKYIDVHWVATNDVDDVRGRGVFKGTGPVEYLSSASWSWNNSLYFLANDATTLRIAKIVLTYMNGTKKILTGNSIVIDDSE